MSTFIISDTFAANDILYANSANSVTGLTSANSSVLVTNGSGVPSLSTDLPTAVTIGGAYIYRAGGTTIPIADGGTNQTSFNTNYLVYYDGTRLKNDTNLGYDGTNLNLGGAAISTVSFAVTKDMVQASGDLFSLYVGGGIGASSGGTVDRAAAIYASANMALSNLGTTTLAAGLYIDSGSFFNGSVTTGYGAIVKAISYGTTRYGLLVETPIGGSVNYTADIGGLIITSAGTITAGVWNGSTIPIAYGGTNNTSFTSNTLTRFDGTKIASVTAGAAQGMLMRQGASGPEWTAIVYPNSASVTGQIIRTAGTSNLAMSTFIISDTFAANDILYANSANSVTGLTSATSSVLVTNGSGVPSLSATLPSAVQGNITATGTISSGVWNGTTVGTSYGGTGNSTPPSEGSIIFGSSLGIYVQDNSNFFWDATNHRLGIRTNSPGTFLCIGSAIDPTNLPGVNLGSTSANVHYAVGQDSTHSAFLRWTYNATAASAYALLGTYGNSNQIQYQASSHYFSAGNVTIGSSTTTSLLNVGSSAQFQVDSSGRVGVGTAAGSTKTIAVSSTAQYGFHMSGTNATGSANHYAMNLAFTSSPTSNSYNSYGIVVQPTFNSSLSGVNAAFGLVVTPTFSGSGTITAHYGIYVDVGSLSGTALTTNYGIYVDALAAGTTRIGLHVAAPTGGMNNYCAYFGGKVGFGVLPLYAIDIRGDYGAGNYPEIRLDASTVDGAFISRTLDTLKIAGNINNAGTIPNSGRATAGIRIITEVSNGYITFGTTGTNNAAYSERFRITKDGNFGFNTTSAFGSGVGVLAIANAGTNPSTNPGGGGVLYADAGAGKWRGSSGTVTTFGPADPHCPVCKSDFGHEWENKKYGGNLRICMKCLTDDLQKVNDNKLPAYIRWNEAA